MPDRLDELFRFQQTALDLRAYRQQLLASNIANADTPNFKARDIDFAAALQGALDGRSAKLPLAAAAPGQQEPTGVADPAPALYRSVAQPSIDGNTVDMDVERERFAENAVHYQADLAILGQKIKLMLAAIQG